MVYLEVKLPHTMQTYAAIDIGSNSCRLKIARVQQHQLKVLHEDREVTRLGASVFETGVVSPEAMASTLVALKRFYRAVKMHSADQVRAVATSALRDARNAQAFLAWVKSETGWEVEIISGLEEARLIHRGVMGEPGTQGRCLLVDVGGGSCEITLSERKRIQETVSLPLGAVRLTKEFLPGDPPSEEELARMKQFIARELRKAERRFGALRVSLVIATSGTAAALAQASQAMRKTSGRNGRSQRQAVGGDAECAPADYQADRHEQRPAQQYSGDRAQADARSWSPAPTSMPSCWSISLCPGSSTQSSACATASWPRCWRSRMPRLRPTRCSNGSAGRACWPPANAMASTPGKPTPCAQHALQLFRDMQAVHELPPEYGSWLEAAAMMRDVGKFMNYQGHHRHAQYIIANSELFGFTPQQRAIMSAIARYLGKSRPDPADRTMRPIPPEEFTRVQRAVVLLRLAVALNQDRASDVLKVTLRVYPKRVLMELSPGRTGAELELWSLRKEGDYFREVFRRELFAALA